MNFKDLKNGDSLLINNKIYEVLYVQEEADVLPDLDKIRKFLAVYLHNENSKSLESTATLWIYSDDEIIFVERGKKIKIFKEDISLK